MKPNDAARQRKNQTLIVGLRDPKARMEAIAAIRKLGSSAAEFLPSLVRVLEDARAQAKPLRSVSSTETDPATAEVVFYGTDLLDSEEAEFRRSVVIALGEIGSGTEKVIRVLIRALEDPEPGVRTAAAGALGRMGLPANVAIPALIRTLEDSKEFVRQIAARALARIDPHDLRIVQPLIEALKDSSPGVRVCAAEALGNARPTEDTAVLLAGVLQDPSPSVRIAAANTLAKFGLAARPVVPALRKALETRFDSVRNAVSAALDRIGA